jgi:hypothetical protein
MTCVGLIAASLTILVVTLFAPAVSAAQSPFDGTWRILMGQSRFTPKPMITFLSEGWFHCQSCNPRLDIKADGTDQPVIGQAYDTISVREVSPATIHLLLKKAGKILVDETQSVSANGRALTVKTSEHPPNGGPVVTAETTALRIGIAPAAINKTSGSWRLTRRAQSENGLLTTYKSSGDDFTMTTPTGQSYTAKFDGMDYPAKGANGYNVVALRRIDMNTIEELDKRDGTVVNTAKMTVSADGKKMTIIRSNAMTDRTTTYIAVKR